MVLQINLFVGSTLKGSCWTILPILPLVNKKPPFYSGKVKFYQPVHCWLAKYFGQISNKIDKEWTWLAYVLKQHLSTSQSTSSHRHAIYKVSLTITLFLMMISNSRLKSSFYARCTHSVFNRNFSMVLQIKLFADSTKKYEITLG